MVANEANNEEYFHSIEHTMDTTTSAEMVRAGPILFESLGLQKDARTLLPNPVYYCGLQV